jgi:hypothetical protein
MAEPAPVQTAQLEQHAANILPSPALTPLDHLLLEGVPRTVSADQDFQATVGQLFQTWENEDTDFADPVGKALVRGPLFASERQPRAPGAGRTLSGAVGVPRPAERRG